MKECSGKLILFIFHKSINTNPILFMFNSVNFEQISASSDKFRAVYIQDSAEFRKPTVVFQSGHFLSIHRPISRHGPSLAKLNNEPTRFYSMLISN